MLDTADKLRKGHADADKPHRETIAKLRARASAILKDAGHAPSEGVLRRVTTTLSAIAAAGGGSRASRAPWPMTSTRPASARSA